MMMMVAWVDSMDGTTVLLPPRRKIRTWRMRSSAQYRDSGYSYFYDRCTYGQDRIYISSTKGTVSFGGGKKG
jgi:hypothetical protein